VTRLRLHYISCENALQELCGFFGKSGGLTAAHKLISAARIPERKTPPWVPFFVEKEEPTKMGVTL